MRSTVRREQAELADQRGMASVLAPPAATVIIPAYNEEEGLPIVLEKIFRVLGDRYEVIVVDDGSQDRTSEVAMQFPCRVLRHEVNRGKGEALKTAILAATTDRVIWIDADDTYPVEMIPRMLHDLEERADMVCASRILGREKIPAFHRFGNRMFALMIRTLYGFNGRDPCTGLCALKREPLLKMGLTGRRFTIDSEIAMKAGRMGLRVRDYPITYGARVGRSKLSGIRDGARILGGIVRHLFWRPPARYGRAGFSTVPAGEDRG